MTVCPRCARLTDPRLLDSHKCGDSQNVDHPVHYTQHPKGIECIDVIEDFESFNVASAIKYLWRAGLKGDAVEDLEKAAWYTQREIERLKRRRSKS